MDSASHVAMQNFTLTIAPTSPLPVSATPSSFTVAAAFPATFMVMVNSTAGFSGTVELAVSGLPSGATASFNPPTLSSAGTTTLTITPPSGAPVGMIPVQVSAFSGSQTFSTTVIVNVAAPSPATLIAPGNGRMLTSGQTPQFTWTAGLGATQYMLNLGSTPGASDIASASTGAGQIVPITLPPCSGNPTIYATLLSYVNGEWEGEGSEFPECGCTGGGGPGGGTAVNPAILFLSSQPYTLNDNQPRVGTYQMWDEATNQPISSQQIREQTLAIPDNSNVSAYISQYHPAPNDSLFDVTFTANSHAQPDQPHMILNYGPTAIFVDLNNALRIYDATPVIYSVQQFPSTSPDGEFYVALYGTNFGPAPGSVGVCKTQSTPCTSDMLVQINAQSCLSQNFGGSPLDSCWSDNQVNVLLVPGPTSSGQYYLQLTSGGEGDLLGLSFQAAPGSQGGGQSNFGGPVQLITVTLSPSALSMSTGDTNQVVATAVSPTSISFSVNYTAAQASVQPPGSPCIPTLSIPSASGTASVSSSIQASPLDTQASPNTCGGVFNLQSFANSIPSSNISVITVPPQALIQQMVGAAGGFSLSSDPGQVAQQSVGIAAKNRFTLPGFLGGTTWQFFQNNGTIENSPATVNGPPVVINNAVAVYTGVVTSSYVGGAPCYWSPHYQDEWIPILSQYQSQPNATTLPSGSGVTLRLPDCYTQTGQYQQVIWKVSEPANTRTDQGGVFLNAPAFLFVKQRNATDPAIVQIP